MSLSQEDQRDRLVDKHLSCKNGDLSLTSKACAKKPRAVAHIRKPNYHKVEADGSMELSGWPVGSR